ncbi:c-type cytochrome [Agriterribacter sp.]|uniref:c-type cytochrome n=1 Tax=Agriterribacter sp. TaxID=2821509 RepID=UPI002B969BAC|nr:c-type cytochrome [Agriterribacter sp.]HTN06701.1 c-type cytochrome [Agriterribacter sp.]
MKKLKKTIKWTVIILLVLVGGLAITVMARQDIKYEAPYPNIAASTDSMVIARGKHLVYSSAHCIDCHSRHHPDSLINSGLEVPLSGGVVFELPVGKIYSKNITPDKATGIGSYSDGEIARALRYGVHPNGTAVFDFMPFHNTSDEDLTAIISYLRAQKPVNNKVPNHELNAIGKAVNAFMIKPVGPTGEVPASVAPDTTAVYGKYLALSVAECSGCHTKRNLAGQFTGESFAGGNEIDGFITPNLTPDSSGKIFNWSKDMFIERFRMGKLIPKSPMPWNSFKRMTDDELTAIYHFLKTLKPVKTPVVKP